MNQDISKKHYIVYAIITTAICLFLILLYYYDRETDTRQQQSPNTVTTWENYTAHTSITKTTITGRLTVDDSIGNVLAFYSIHQNIEVYANNELIYQYPIKNNNPLSDSPGYCWNFIELPFADNNLEITITSPYSSYMDKIPAFYIGNDFSLSSYIVSSSLLPFLLCIIMLVLGIVMIVFHLVVIRNVNTKGKLLKLGVFSIFLSVWSMNECEITTLILKNNLVTSYLSFLSLMLLPFPFAVFVKTFYEDGSKIWNTFCKINILQIVICIILQVIGLADLRESLWTTHVMMCGLVLIVFVQSYKLLKNTAQSQMIKIHMICIIICAVSLIMDILGYYFGSGDGNTFGRIGFLSYIVILGISSAKESASLMKMGQEANAYQRLAYTDQMTGLNNRTCFNIDFGQLSENPEDVAVIDFDLNNLKYTNDTLGHSAGDRYIKNCATIIYEIFNGIGKCYRVGGDEFVALIENSSEIDLTQYLAMLESSVDASNRENKDLKMQIAYGCAVYTSEMDKDLEDTYNRADKIMYKDKKDKKNRFTK